MAYWESLVNSPSYAAYAVKKAAANTYPQYEIDSPQYTSPSPYSLAQQGFRTNTLIYACIQRRLRAVSSAPMWVYDITNGLKTKVSDIPEARLIAHPNERVNQQLFWQITSMYMDIAGVALWEIERNNVGEPIALWPMRPDWCSFMRDEERPIGKVRYQPYGLPYQDVSIDNILTFQQFDPIHPLLTGYSPTMSVLRDIAVDNGMTDFLYDFIRNGAKFSGLLSTDQDIDDVEAERIRRRWRTQHGGSENWSDIAVLGHGSKYQNISMDFEQMAFPELDGRIEARICMAFEISPILLGTKVGLRAATLSNYSQARKAWYEEWVTPQWEYLASQYHDQMFRKVFNKRIEYNDNILCEFMTRNVAALQENRDLEFRRAISAARANVFTRDQALNEMRLAPVDGKPVYVGPVSGISKTGPASGAYNTGAEYNDKVAQSDNQEVLDEVTQQGSAPAYTAEQILEQKQFKSYASKRVREGKLNELYAFVWVYNDSDTAHQMISQYEE